MKYSTVSVVIPAFNAEATILRALASVAAQSTLPAEIIVVDDGSTDRTAQICTEFLLSTNLNHKVVRRSNGGVSSARNAAVSISTSSFIAFLDADDEWNPLHLEHFHLAIREFPTAVLYYCGIERVFDGGAEVPQELLPNFNAISESFCIKAPGVKFGIVEKAAILKLIRGSFIPPSSAVIGIDFALRNPFSQSLSFAEDHIFFLKAMLYGKAIYCEDIGCTIHRHASNASLTTSATRSYFNNSNALRAWFEIIGLPEIKSNRSYLNIAQEELAKCQKLAVYYSSAVGVGTAMEESIKFLNVPGNRSVSNFFWILKQLSKTLLRRIQSIGK